MEIGPVIECVISAASGGVVLYVKSRVATMQLEAMRENQRRDEKMQSWIETHTFPKAEANNRFGRLEKDVESHGKRLDRLERRRRNRNATDNQD